MVITTIIAKESRCHANVYIEVVRYDDVVFSPCLRYYRFLFIQVLNGGVLSLFCGKYGFDSHSIREDDKNCGSRLFNKENINIFHRFLLGWNNN